MSLLKKIFGRKLLPKEKRKSPRKQLKEILKIQLTIDGNKFQILDFSNTGIGLFNESGASLSVGKIYSAELIAHGQKRNQIKLKVIRKNEQIFGCEIINQEAFLSFKNDYLILSTTE